MKGVGVYLGMGVDLNEYGTYLGFCSSLKTSNSECHSFEYRNLKPQLQ